MSAAAAHRAPPPAINGPSDLIGRRVATLRDSSAHQYLERHAIKSTLVDSVVGGFELLLDDKVAAVVADAPALRHAALRYERLAQLQLLPTAFERHQYAALCRNAELAWQTSDALLRLRDLNRLVAS